MLQYRRAGVRARGAAHRGSRRRPRGTLEGARRAVQRGRPARLRPTTPQRCSCCAAALVTTTTVACPVVGSGARYHRLQMATGAEHGAKAANAQRAGDWGRAYLANRHRHCIGTRSCVRHLTRLPAIGAGFGHGTRTHTLSRALTGREASKCAVRPQSAARADHLGRSPGAQITTTGSPKSVRSQLGASVPMHGPKRLAQSGLVSCKARHRPGVSQAGAESNIAARRPVRIVPPERKALSSSARTPHARTLRATPGLILRAPGRGLEPVGL